MQRATCAALLSMLLAVRAAASAQERPLRTHDPEPVPAGTVLVELGFDAEWDRAYPLSGLVGDVARPTLALVFGLGGVAEFEVGAGFNVLFVDERGPAPLADELDFDGDATTDIEDPVVATKIRLQREGRVRPATGLRFATRLPSAGNDSGLGNDAIDVFIDVLAGKTIAGTRVAANFGMGILSVPTRGDRQNDVLTGGLSIERPFGARLSLVAEANGRIDVKGDTPAGTEDRGQGRLGARYDLGSVRLDGAAIFGLTDADADVGLTVGVTWDVPYFGRS